MEEGRSAFKILTANLQEGGLDVDGKTILEWTLEEIDINLGNWVDSAQNRDYWRALVNATLNLWVL